MIFLLDKNVILIHHITCRTLPEDYLHSKMILLSHHLLIYPSEISHMMSLSNIVCSQPLSCIKLSSIMFQEFSKLDNSLRLWALPGQEKPHFSTFLLAGSSLNYFMEQCWLMANLITLIVLGILPTM